MTDEYDWKRVQPILAWLREKNFVTVDEVHEELNRLLQAASQQPKKQATVYKWFTGENNPRKEKGSDSDIVESIVNSTLNVVRRRKPEHAEDIQEALYEQNPVHLRIIEGRGYPLPDECLTPSHAIKSFLGHFVLYRVGRNFFLDSFLWDAPLLAIDFYISAGVFLVLWSGVLVMAFSGKMRNGIKSRVEDLAEELAQGRFAGGLFPRLEQSCREIELSRARLDGIATSTAALRSQVAASPALGSRISSRETAVEISDL